MNFIIRTLHQTVFRMNKSRETRNAYELLVEKPNRKRWQENIRMDLRKIGCEGVDWIHLDQCRDQWRALVNSHDKSRLSDTVYGRTISSQHHTAVCHKEI
jgi:hypothetical protein